MLPGGRGAARHARRRRSWRCRCVPTLIALSGAVLVVLWLRSAAAVVSSSPARAPPVPEPDARALPVRLGSARAAEAPSTEEAERPVPESFPPADDAPAGLRNAAVVVGVMTCARYIGTRCRTQVRPVVARTRGPRPAPLTRTASAGRDLAPPLPPRRPIHGRPRARRRRRAAHTRDRPLLHTGRVGAHLRRRELALRDAPRSPPRVSSR